MQDLPALRLEGVFARKAQCLRLAELSGADRDEVEILAGLAVRSFKFQRPAGLAIGPAIHRDHTGLEAHRAIEPMAARIVGEIGVDLRTLGPFRIGIRHRLVGVAIEVLGALRLHVRIGTRGIPDSADISALLDDGDLVPVRGKRFRRCQARHSGADHANLLWAYHVIFPLVRCCRQQASIAQRRRCAG